MRLFRHTQDLPADARGAAVALGNFDGLHHGHRKVIAAAADAARDLGAPLGVLTTDPHPRLYFQPSQSPFQLSPMRAKTHLLGELGVDILYLLAFDAKLAAMFAQDFIEQILVRGMGVRHIAIGYDYRFGRGRIGDPILLIKAGRQNGFGVTVVEPVADGGEVYSSSVIRQALAEGKPRRAAELLGHWWGIAGRVAQGDQRGRTIGFPTANLSTGEYMQPRLGVYAVRATIGETGQRLDGIANLGRRPTFDKAEVNLEVHLFDFAGDLYGKHLGVEFVDFVRPERKFDGLDSLKAQIAADCATARAMLADPANAVELFRLRPLKEGMTQKG